MGCGASSAQKVSPSIKDSNNNCKPKDTPSSVKGVKDESENSKTKSSENVRPPSSKEKLLKNRPSSHSGSIRSAESPKLVKSKKLVRDSRGSVRPQSASSINSDLERKFSGDIRKRESVEKLFQASSSSSIRKPEPPASTVNGDNTMKPKPLAFEVALDTKPPKMRPPRRLESLKNAPKPLTQKELQEKMKLSDERRELEIQRKKLKSSRMSRRKRELVEAREQSKMQEQSEEIKGKMDSTTMNRERLQAEKAEKQRKRLEHAQKVRERARRLKQGELDEGLGAEMETYKPESDDDAVVNRWSASDDQEQTLNKTATSASIDSRASLDTIDSGVPKITDESTDQFYNA